MNIYLDNVLKMNHIMSLPTHNPNFPFHPTIPNRMLVEPRELAAKMLKSMTRDRALSVARNIYDNHTINQADKDNLRDIITVLNGGEVKKKVYNNKFKAHNADFNEVDKPEVGEKYHASWAHKGCVWVCIRINSEDNTVTLKTPKTGKFIRVKIKDLRHLRNKS